MSKRTRNLQRNAALGAFLLVCLGLLTYLTFRLGGLSLAEEATWTAYFGTESTVKKDSEVFVAGTKVGRVVDVRLVPDEEIAPGRYVRVELSLRKDLAIWEDAALVMRARGLLGRAALELVRGTPGRRRLTPETPLPGRTAGDPLDSLNDLIDENRGNIRQFTADLAEVAGKLKRGEGSVGRLLADDGLYEKAVRIADDVAAITRAARSTDGSLGLLLNDRALYDRVLSGAARLDEVAEQIRAGRGPLGRLVYDEKVAEDVEDLVARARSIARALDEGEGMLGRLIRDRELHETFSDAMRAIRSVAVRLESGEGSLGRLLADDGTMFRDFQRLAANLGALSDDIAAGKGSLGLLLKDDSLYREAQRVIESFRETGEVARENAPLASLVSFTSLFFNVLN